MQVAIQSTGAKSMTSVGHTGQAAGHAQIAISPQVKAAMAKADSFTRFGCACGCPSGSCVCRSPC